MRALLFTAALALAAATPAHATPKSRGVAQALAGVGTGVSAGLVVSSLFLNKFGDVANAPLLLAGLGSSIITPSLGQIYAHDYLTLGMAARAVAGAMIAYGAFEMTSSKRCLTDTGAVSMCSGITQQGLVVIGLGAIAYIGGVAYDINDASDAVDRYNRTQGVFVQPTIGLARGAGDRAIPTVGITARF